jgi:hypothetical protein
MSYSLAHKITRYIQILLVLLPAITIAYLIIEYAVPLPVMDDWPMGWFLCKTSSGFFSLNDLIAQSNETRPVIPRLALIILTFFTGWNVYYHMALTFLLACMISFNIYKLCTIIFPDIKNIHALLMMVANLMVFSPLQHQNWLWGIQFIVFIPIFCLTLSLLIYYSNYSDSFKLLASILLCIISTYSYANGMICWFLLIPVLVYQNYRNRNFRKLLTIFLLAMILCITMYFINYVKPSHHPQFDYAISHLLKAFEYFTAFIGSPVSGRYGNNNSISIFISGITVILIFLLFIINIFHNIRNKYYMNRTLPWLLIALYSLFSAIITTVGRSGFGTYLQALDSRYTTFSIYLPLSFIFLGVLLFDSQKIKSPAALKRMQLPVYFLIICIFITYIINTSYTRKVLSDRENSYNNGIVYFSLVKIMPSKIIEDVVFPDLNWLRPRVLYMNRMNFLPIKIVEDLDLSKIKGDGSYPIAPYGKLNKVTYLTEKVCEISGEVCFPLKTNLPHALFLAYNNAAGKPILFQYNISPLGFSFPSHVVEKCEEGTFIEWRVMVSRVNFPAKTGISAWIYDAFKIKAYKLKNNIQI